MHQRDLAKEKVAQKKKQMEFGLALQEQLMERRRKEQEEVESKIRLAKSMKRDALRYEEEEFRKVLDAKERNLRSTSPCQPR
jgi:hypothetical protein